jgi:P27 family predicted phage terminase small subunit
MPCGAWEPPDHLSDVSREAWRHVVGLLDAAGNLDRTDPMLVEMYATNVAMLRDAQKALEESGAVVEGRWGPLTNPACGVVNMASMRLKAIINDLGLCPASSKRAAGKSEATVANKWDGLLGVVNG